MPIHIPAAAAAAAAIRPISLTKLFLITFLFLYSLSNLVLSVIATVAWTNAHRVALSEECYRYMHGCSMARWGVYFLCSVAAFVSFATTAMVASKSIFRPGRAVVDAEQIFRCVVFTLIVFAPVFYIGWTPAIVPDATVWVDIPVSEPHNQGKSTSLNGNGTSLPAAFTYPHVGLHGGFIFEMADKLMHTTVLACHAAHFTFAFGVTLAGIAIAAIPVPLKTTEISEKPAARQAALRGPSESA